jgi:glycosyltransferase involved in cell wall biosynthesis
MKKLNILFFSEYFPDLSGKDLTGGVEARCYNIAKNLAKNHKVTIITTSQKNRKTIEKSENITVIRCCKLKYSRKERFMRRLFLNWHYFFTARRLIKKQRFDIVEGYNFFTYAVASIIGRLYNIKSYATYHEVWINDWVKNTGSVFGLLGELFERLALFCLKSNKTRFIAVSNFTRRALVGVGIKKDLVTVVHNGVDPKDFKDIKGNKFKRATICCIARLSPHKRVEDLIRAIVLVKKELPTINCLVIGDGEERERLQKLINKSMLQNNVKLLGRVEKNVEKLEKLKSSHLFCLPSALEGFGIVVVEAMACKVPYVCSDIPPLVEVTNNGQGGMIFKTGNYKDLAEKILLLLKNKKLYNKKINEQPKLVKNYDWKKLAHNVERLYAKS